MAINATRGLPSFSEMYTAFKNRGSLADTINAGVEGYKTGSEMKRKELAQESQSTLEKAQAKKAAHEAEVAKDQPIRLDQILDPKEKMALSQYATPDTNGVLMIPTSVYNAVTKRELGAEANNLRTKLQQTEAEKATAAAQAAQEKLALSQELGPKAQKISAAKGLVESAGKVEAPSMAGRLFNPIVEKVTGAPLESVLAERQRTVGNKVLQYMATDTATGIPSAGPSSGAGSQASPVPVYTPEDYANIPIGTWFVDSTGKPAQKRYK